LAQAPQRKPIPKYLTGQKAVVTGASSGIGRGVALSLAQAGADVLVNYSHDEQGADETVAEIRGCGVRAIPWRADVSSESEIQAMFRAATDELGGVDILVNKAGIQKDAPFDQMSLEQWKTVLDINLTGQFLCAREAVRLFKARGVRPQVSAAAGKIICISSVHELIPWAGHVNYAASKGGIRQMMRSIAQEVAPLRIRVNTISPGAIATPINKDAWETPEARAKLLKLIPYGRIGVAEDIGRVAAWLASDEADYIHGATIFVDGGMTLFPDFASGG
jgi:glucose 1-dehydrogenase